MNGPPNATAQTADFEFAALQEARNYRNALLRDFSPYFSGQGLEVGAGIGQISGELLKKRGFDIRAVRFYDRLVFPLVHAIESKICPPPFGQSLMAVARAK